MTEAIESTVIRQENGAHQSHQEGPASDMKSQAGHQKQASTSSAKAVPESDSGKVTGDSQQSTFEQLQPTIQPVSSPMYIQKSGDGDEEDYDPYPYGSAMSGSFVPPTAEAVAQAQAEQIALLQHHQSVQQPKLQGKGKDLSHVPCRFFKVGGCTAGLACPFSHSLGERECLFSEPEDSS
jgi:hypothetical protein